MTIDEITQIMKDNATHYWSFKNLAGLIYAQLQYEKQSEVCENCEFLRGRMLKENWEELYCELDKHIINNPQRQSSLDFKRKEGK